VICLLGSHLINKALWDISIARVIIHTLNAAVLLLGLWIRIPPGAWISVSFECCVLSGRGLCDGLITRPGESYRLWCVSECDREAAIMRGPWPTRGCCTRGKNNTHSETFLQIVTF
jgi:hypothetical protein